MVPLVFCNFVVVNSFACSKVSNFILTNMLDLQSFVLQRSENGTSVPKHVGVLIIVTNCILLSALFCKYIDNKNNFRADNSGMHFLQKSFVKFILF
jgi:hypothetical protein